jgi:glycosyltransferase involved in cell wall biosynthesis
MRILFLNLYFPPDTSATAKAAESMVRALAQSHEVTVLCGRPSYDPTERRPWKIWQTERFSAQVPEGGSATTKINSNAKTFMVIRVGSTDYPRIQMQRRILNYLTYAKLGALRALFVPCDVIFAMTDPPFLGITAAFLAMLKRKPLVYDIQDLYPDMAVAGSIVQAGLLSQVWERFHRWAMSRATRIIVLGNDMRARILSKADKRIDPAKIVIVRSGIESPIDPGPMNGRLNPEIISAIRGDSRFVVLHAGNLGFYGAWDTIIAAARQLERDNIGFVFVGDGAERNRLASLAAGARNIHFLPFFPSRDISSVLAAPDAHVVTIKRGLEGVVVPSKTFGILAAGKPIIAVAPIETDVAALGASNGFAICADPSDASALASAIRHLSLNPAQVEAMGKAASAAATKYVQDEELRRFVTVVSAVET